MSSKNNNKNSKNKTTASNNAPYSTTRNRRSTQKAKKLPSAIKYSFNDLPIDIMNAVIDCMTTPTFLQFRLVSKKWMRLCWKGRRTLDLTYVEPSRLPKVKELHQLLEKAHGLRSLKTHMNITGSMLTEALDLERGCMSLNAITIDQKLQHCNEESFLVTSQQHLTRFTEIKVKGLHSRTFPGFGPLTQLRSLQVGNIQPDQLLGLTNLICLKLGIELQWSAWSIVLEQNRNLELLSVGISEGSWFVNLTRLAHLKCLKFTQTNPTLTFSQYADQLHRVLPQLTRLEEINYPAVRQYWHHYHTSKGELRNCHEAAFPPSIKRIHNLRSESFGGLHSCLNLESLSVVSIPSDRNFEELHGLAKLQEVFVIPLSLSLANCQDPILTDRALISLKYATGLHTLSFGFGWGAFTDLTDIHQFQYLRHLSLNGYSLTSRAITNIAQCKYLFSLAINRMQDITPTTFRPLTRLKYLTCLMLYNMEELTEKTSKQLDDLTQLRDLRLERCKNITDAAIMNLSTIVPLHLLHLDITETAVSTKGRQFVRHLLKPSKREHLWWLENLPIQ